VAGLGLVIFVVGFSNKSIKPGTAACVAKRANWRNSVT
jgi:hypothetical protein